MVRCEPPTAPGNNAGASTKPSALQAAGIPHTMNKKHLVLFLLSTLVCCGTWAGRPLLTDDAAVANRGECYLESFAERDRSERALNAVFTCGIGHDIELALGASQARSRPGGDTTRVLGLLAKWAPAAGEFETQFGKLSLGASLATTAARNPGGRYQHADSTVLGLASLEPLPGLAVHLNLGGRA